MANVRFVYEKPLRNEGLGVHFGSQKDSDSICFFELFGSLGDLGRPMASKGDQSRPKDVQKTTKSAQRAPKATKSEQKDI